jgi:riboflavin kinase / FMN adenylyltransferase
MQHYHSLDSLALQDAWLTIGIFDGVHRGHQEILRRLVSGAHKEGSPAVVLTFTPHPAVVLGGKTDFQCLTTPGERVELLESLGVDGVITQTFDRALASQTAEEFMRRVARTLGLRRLLIGYDTALGRGREGNAARLTEIGQELGYIVQVVPPLKDEAGILSSTRIRAAVAAGNVPAAASDLGRYFFVAGPVIHGDGRGQALNIPTANIRVPAGKLIPANGIYATWAWVGGKKYRAATSIGIRPTFTPEESVPHVEAHILDFEKDLYGHPIKLEFVEYLRPEEKFPSVEALIEQIHADIARARKILN